MLRRLARDHGMGSPRMEPDVTKRNITGLTRRQRRFFATAPGDAAGVRVRGLGLGDELPAGCVIDRPRGSGDWLLLCWHDPVRLGPQAAPRAADEVICYRPGAAQWYATVGPRLRHSWIHLSGAAVDAQVEDLALPTDVPIAVGARAVVDRYLGLVAAECDRGAGAEPQLLVHLVGALLIELDRLHRGSATIPAHLHRVHQLLDDDYAADWSLARLAAEAGCSPQHLGRGFRAAFGLSPMAYLSRVRMQHARWLLADGRRSIAEIGAAVGVPDRFGFSRSFKRCFGCSPREWRALHRGG